MACREKQHSGEGFKECRILQKNEWERIITQEAALIVLEYR